jgi:hypothetical protein
MWQNLSSTKNQWGSSTLEISKSGEKVVELGKHKLGPEKLGKLGSLKNLEKVRRNWRFLQGCFKLLC